MVRSLMLCALALGLAGVAATTSIGARPAAAREATTPTLAAAAQAPEPPRELEPPRKLEPPPEPEQPPEPEPTELERPPEPEPTDVPPAQAVTPVHASRPNPPLADPGARVLPLDAGRARRTAEARADPNAATVVWKTLVLVYRETDIIERDGSGATRRFRARIGDADLALQLRTVNEIVPTLETWSGGRVTLDVEIVLVDHPVDRLDATRGGASWFGPAAARADLDRYAPAGRYDSIITIWQDWNTDGESLPTRGWGLTMPPGSWANGAGYSSILVPPQQWWITDRAYPAEVFVHEWMHQSLGYFMDQGYGLPDLHRGTDYGYDDDAGSWAAWYSDILTAQVPSSGGGTTGVSPALWHSGQPTDP